jgi:DNA topoisomerase-1
MKYLVIVESPSKCKKIEKYLNDNDILNIYEVVATMGHITELKSLKNINFEDNFNCIYDTSDSKKKQIEIIRKKIKSNDEVILALDGDREGEGIAYHVCSVFNLDVTKTKRIIFNEITEKALTKSVANPTTINMDIVRAQQARQIMDLLVGFKLSPTLWKHVSKENSLSAGRCQSPALKLIYDNQKDINCGEEVKIYNTTGYFTSKNIPFELNKKFESDKDVQLFLKETSTFSHVYNFTGPVKSIKKQPEPFTTSRIQQVASNELHYSPKETMKICQELYEGGYITYMRTDSKIYSAEFIDSVKKYITTNFEERYVSKNIDELSVKKMVEEKETKTKTKKKVTKEPKPDSLTQDAHEAIRPTDIFLKELPEDLSSKERKMYKLIWTNTLESCMPPAIYNAITANITAAQNTTFSYRSEQVDFAGWKIVASKLDEDIFYQFLQTMKSNLVVAYKKILSKVTLKNTKSHYSEARLVQLLEENGIGRPSTFSMLVDKIQEKEYVKKQDIKGKEIECKDFELDTDKIVKELMVKREFGNEKGKLVIQPLGIIVAEFLERYFGNLINYEFTKQMEDDLDRIANKEIVWHETCGKCNDKINECLTELGETVTDSRPNSNIKDAIIGNYEGHAVTLKKGKFGLYVTWGENSKTLKELGNRPVESITFEEIEKFLDEGSNNMREVSPNLSIRRSKKGFYVFFKTAKMKKPQFYDLNGFKEDYKTCELDVLKSWIKEKHGIY